MPQNSELIIVDDCSTDNSVKIINDFAQQDQRIRIHKNPRNMGPVYASNAGLNLARGKFISFLGADDYIYPSFFTKMLQVMEKHPSIGLCCSIAASCENYIPGTIPSNITASPLIDDIHKPVAFTREMIVDIFKTTDFWVAGATALVRTELCHQHKGFRECLGPFCDWMLLHSIALKEGAAYIPEILAIWNHHQSNYSSISHCRHKFFLTELLKLLNSDMRPLKPLFLQSCLLRSYLKPCLFWLAYHPKYWNFLPPIAFRYFKKRLKKVLKATKRLIP
jgi:glycosyltransferase involved in cell wall biosynthesis